jgi:hypothetical protein
MTLSVKKVRIIIDANKLYITILVRESTGQAGAEIWNLVLEAEDGYRESERACAGAKDAIRKALQAVGGTGRFCRFKASRH